MACWGLVLLTLLAVCRAAPSASLADVADDTHLIRYLIRRRLPARSCTVGKIFLIDGLYKRLGQGPDDIETFELGYRRSTDEQTKSSPCHLLQADDAADHVWLSEWLDALFPGRLVRRVYPAPETGFSWPKSRSALHRTALVQTGSGQADKYAVLFLSSPDDLQN